MGSKNRIAKDILAIMQPEIDKLGKYVEPFCGGCNMMDKVICKDRWANDINRYLIALFQMSQHRNSFDYVPKAIYDDVNRHRSDWDPWFVGYVGFICSFRGKFFGGYNGKVGIRNFQEEAKNNFLKQMFFLRGVKFTSMSYLDMEIHESVIYCDPPYQGTTQYKDSFDHSKFWDWCRKMNVDNKVFVSEYSAPSDFKCVMEKKILNNLRAGKANVVTEKIFTL